MTITQTHINKQLKTDVKTEFWTRTVAGTALSALSAVMLTAAFPPYNLWYLAFIGMVPMLLAQYRIMPRKLSGLAPAIGIGGFVGGYLTPVFAGTGTYMQALPLVVAVITYFTESGNRDFHTRTGYRWFILSGVAGWIGMELLRSFAPIAGTWAFIGYALYDQAWFLQPVSIFGTFGLCMLIVLVDFVLAQATLQWFDQHWTLDNHVVRPETKASRRWLVITGVTLAGWTLLSLVMFTTPENNTVRVAALHINGATDSIGNAYEILKQQSLEAAAQGAEFIVWPEGAVLGDPLVDQPELYQHLAQETGAYIAIGYIVPEADNTWRNEATIVDPDGNFLGIFGKDHPVVFAGEKDTSLGVYPVYDTPIGKLATIICYDLDFIDTARKVARNGAQIVAVPSHDWEAIAEKHYTHLVFRALENGVSMVKSDSSGNDSAIIDPQGRIIEKLITPGGADGIIIADVPVGNPDTVNMRTGDWIGWLSVAGMLVFMAVDARSKKRSKQTV